jgi:hypothetical protein
MHAHRIAGQPVPSSDPPWSDRVRGLGVCDALQLQLEPEQLPWLLDELDELSVAHEQGLSEAAARRAITGDPQIRRDATEDVDDRREELALLRAVRERISGAPDGPAVVCGPAPLLSSVVRGVTQAAAERLAELAGEFPTGRDAEASGRILSTAAATNAWVQTLVALQRLEWFTFKATATTPTSSGDVR